MKHSFVFKLADFMRKHGYNFREETRPEVALMQKEIASLDNRSINFAIKYYPDGSWVAKSSNVDGILTGGRNQAEAQELIKDAIFTYYGVPPQYARDSLLRNTSEPIKAEQKVHVTA
jgi:predicted RNase H-like HicB family nuclease